MTARELEIITLLARHQQNKEIARELHISPETVKSHLKRIYRKLGVGTRREAARKSVTLGIASAAEQR